MNAERCVLRAIALRAALRSAPVLGALAASSCVSEDPQTDDASAAASPQDASLMRDASAAADPDAGASMPRDASFTPSDSGARDAGAMQNDAAAHEAGMQANSEAGLEGGVLDASGGAGCSAAYRLCEDFESAELGGLPADWTLHNGWGSGMPEVVAEPHRSGTRALKSAVSANGQPRAARSLSALGAARGKHWGRVYYRFEAPATIPPVVDPMPPNNKWLHNTLVALEGSTESRVVDTVVDTSGKHQFLYNLPDDSCCTASAYDYDSYDGAWHCAEWYVDAATQSFRFFYEGQEVKALAFSYGADTKAHIEPYGEVVLGLINYQTTKLPYNVVYFDDLAIDDARVGCD